MTGDLSNLTPEHFEKLHSLALASGVGPGPFFADIVVAVKRKGYRVEDLINLLYADKMTERVVPLTGKEFQAYLASLTNRGKT